MILVAGPDASLADAFDERCVRVASRADVPADVPAGALLLLDPDAFDEPRALVAAVRERAAGALAVVAVADDPGTRATAWYDGVLTPGVSDATVREIADRARRIASYRAAVADFYDVSPDEGTHAARERAAERFDDLPSDLDADDIAALLRTEG